VTRSSGVACDVGLIPQEQWRLVYGRNTVRGNTVDHNYGNEARTISTTERTSQDAVFSTVATLNSGWGYGIWLRASVYTGASISGYSFQYDPGYENVNPGFGKALLLRLWTNGTGSAGTRSPRSRGPRASRSTHRIG